MDYRHLVHKLPSSQHLSFITTIFVLISSSPNVCTFIHAIYSFNMYWLSTYIVSSIFLSPLISRDTEIKAYYIFLHKIWKKKFKISRCWQDYSEIGTLFLKTLEISVKSGEDVCTYWASTIILSNLFEGNKPVLPSRSLSLRGKTASNLIWKLNKSDFQRKFCKRRVTRE